MSLERDLFDFHQAFSFSSIFTKKQITLRLQSIVDLLPYILILLFRLLWIKGHHLLANDKIIELRMQRLLFKGNNEKTPFQLSLYKRLLSKAAKKLTFAKNTESFFFISLENETIAYILTIVFQRGKHRIRQTSSL